MNNCIIYLFRLIPVVKHWALTRENIKFKIKIKNLFWYFKSDKSIYWPVHKNSTIVGADNILIGTSDEPANNVGGCYIQGLNGLILGGYNLFGPNVAVITSNHNENNIIRNKTGKPTLIGSYCWIGFGAVLLPEIQLGDHVIIGANSVVKGDIPSYCIAAGNPAKIIKKINKEKILKPNDKYEYYGFIKKKSKKGKAIQLKRIEKLREYYQKYGDIISETLKKEMNKSY